MNRFVEFLKSEKLPVTKCCQNPCFQYFHSTFCIGFVFWLYRSGGNNCCAIMLCHFMVRTVKDKFRPCIFDNSSFKIIRNKDTGHSSKERIRMYMRFYPVIRFHIRKRFCITVQAAGKDSNKNICRYFAAISRIIHFKCISDPVDFHGFSRFAFNPESCFL